MMDYSIKIDKPTEKRKLTIVATGTVRDLLDFADSLENAGEYGLAEEVRGSL